jgi:hypothetical protein
MRFLKVTMPDGSRWAVPAEVVARSYADHYEGTENTEGAEYKSSFNEAMGNASILRDWAQNNMNWSDVAHCAKKVEPAPQPKVDFQEGWINGPMEVFDEKEGA